MTVLLNLILSLGRKIGNFAKFVAHDLLPFNYRYLIHIKVYQFVLVADFAYPKV